MTDEASLMAQLGALTEACEQGDAERIVALANELEDTLKPHGSLAYLMLTAWDDEGVEKICRGLVQHAGTEFAGQVVNKTLNGHQYPIHWAMSTGRERKLRAVVAAGADVNKALALHKAMQFGGAHKGPRGGGGADDPVLAVVKYLVEEAGADVNAEDINGHTPLHEAAHVGNNAVVRYLVEKGCDLEHVSKYAEETPVLVAVGEGNGSTVKLLVELGADMSVVDGNGRSAVQLARRHGFLDEMPAEMRSLKRDGTK